ncbi:MAG: DUF559 domain-containing protein [Pseudomonadota bacterium]
MSSQVDHELELVTLAAWANVSASELSARAEAQGIPNLVVPISEDVEPLGELLLQLETTVSMVFPAWLPEAEGITSPGGAGLAALETLARVEAGRSNLFGPYLIAMATHALTRSPGEAKDAFAPEIRLRECHKLFLRAYGAMKAAIIIELSPGLSPGRLGEVQQAAFFVAAQGGFRVWLTGAGLGALERIPQHTTKKLAGVPEPSVLPVPAQPHFTPISGKPHPLSETENRMEAFLCQWDWAPGRAWNASWSEGPLSNPVTVDLIWAAERLVVEFDGADHLAHEKYLRDRQRDRALQAAGFAVLRFTNEEIADDLAERASEIERFLRRARSENS